MSRITGTDAFNMMEAYNAVYTPQELTEEQVWEEVEAWVNSLVEEGYDLSEYTWEGMYEHYLNEAPIRYSTGPTAADLQRQRAQASTRPAPAQNLRGLTVGPGGFNINGRPVQPGMSPIFQRPGQPAPTRPAPARPAAQAPARPATAPARPPAAPAGTSRPNASTRPATPSYSGATGVRPVGTPLPTNAVTPVAGAPAQNAPVSAPASRPSLATQAAELRAMRKASQQRIIAQGGTPATPLVQSFDPFDIVMGYLIDEGYAENEEAASVIMANMSEEWKESILDEGFKRMNRSKIEKQAKRLGGDRGDILRDVAKRMDTPAERKYSTSQARKNRAGGSGSEYRKAQELRARDDAKADFEKYGLH